MSEHGFAISGEAIRQIGQVQAGAARLGHYALWAIAAVLAYFVLR